jgi:hypothetical protein
MANPNIVNVSEILGKTDYLIPSTTVATTWTALTPASGTVHKLNSITAANVGSAPVLFSLSINSAVAGGGTAYRVAFEISIPVGTTIIVVDKTSSLYVGEDQSVVVTSAIANAIEFVASYEAIT